jgi:hypothetical protein
MFLIVEFTYFLGVRDPKSRKSPNQENLGPQFFRILGSIPYKVHRGSCPEKKAAETKPTTDLSLMPKQKLRRILSSFLRTSEQRGAQTHEQIHSTGTNLN